MWFARAQGARDPFFVAAADNLQITLSSVEVHSACVDGDGAVLSSTFHRLDVVLQDAHLHDNHAAQVRRPRPIPELGYRELVHFGGPHHAEQSVPWHAFRRGPPYFAPMS